MIFRDVDGDYLMWKTEGPTDPELARRFHDLHVYHICEKVPLRGQSNNNLAESMCDFLDGFDISSDEAPELDPLEPNATFQQFINLGLRLVKKYFKM